MPTIEPTKANRQIPRRASLALCLGWAIAVSGCADTSHPEIGVTKSALRRVENCAEVASVVRRAALAEMNAQMDQVEQAARENAHTRSCTHASTVSTSGLDAAVPSPGATSSAPVAATSSVPPGASTASQTSTTNNQVLGVDEADFIKNDDKYVYAAVNGALRIIEAWPAEQAREIAKVQLPGTPKKLFVEKDRALVYVALPREELLDNIRRLAGGLPFSPHEECTYGYDCEFTGDGTATAVLVFDISDRTAPKQLRRIDAPGSLLAARRIGDAVHTVLVTPELKFPGLKYPNILGSCEVLSPEALELELARIEDARAQNRVIIENTELEQVAPWISEHDRNLTSSICSDVYAETISTGSSFTTLMSLDMARDEAPGFATIVSKPGAVYASSDALYIAINQSGPFVYESVIHKLSLGQEVDATAYQASGRLKGNVLNQFSMDEHDQHLRVATSFGRSSNADVHNTLSVLSQRGDELVLDGVVDQIAPGEDIRSVRFDGERGYVVTFKQTDPLYVLDLADPQHPSISGELKIPGFSTYMHMFDEKHLLTIGYDTSFQGSFAFITGVLVQLFDVSDMQAPKLAHKLAIGSRSTGSEALTNHLAFTLFGDKLAVPMSICEGSDDPRANAAKPTFSGLMVFDVSVQAGISERGRVTHPDQDGESKDLSCRNLWTNSNSLVKRSIFMDDFVYSIAPNVMRVQALDALGDDVAVVSLAR